MKKYIIVFAILISAIIVFSSCDKEEHSAKPEISLNELGYDNSRIGYVNSDLHIEAEIVAAGNIDKIQVTIHPESEHEEKNTKHEAEWEYDSIYTEFSGLKNTTFHKHVDIPAEADTGAYHVHIIVTDMEGQQTSVEAELNIIFPTDLTNPVITISSAPTSGQTFTNGESISISGIITDNMALGGLYVALVRGDQGLEDSGITDQNTITLLHTHDFEGASSFNFTASINAGAATDNNITPKSISGDLAWQNTNYYIVVKTVDPLAEIKFTHTLSYRDKSEIIKLMQHCLQ
jgi:hypothetical protein